MKTLLLITLVLLLFQPAESKNLQLIDHDDVTGFAIYRTGAPKSKDMRKICDLGIEEMYVLSGNAKEHEEKYQDECPTLKVIYNEKQSPHVSVTEEFLEGFDEWVQKAQDQGKKIAFRCNCGCHRTGRLAAYYQMKYQNLTSKDAIAIMIKHGKWMFLYPGLKHQVRAMKEYLSGVECTQKEKWCVQDQVSLERVLAQENFPEVTFDEP